MRVIKVLAPAVAAAALYACVDGPLSTRSGGVTALSLAPQFSFAGPAGGLPIEFVRTTPVFAADGSPAGPRHITTVDSEAETFAIDAQIDLEDRDSATVEVLIEMFSNGSGSDIVEWSAWVGPIHIVADETPSEYAAEVTMVRGPIENLGVESLSVTGPSLMFGSTSASAHATVTARSSYSVIWSSSARAIADVEPVGDTVLVHALTSGSAWIRAGAGLYADSFRVQVEATEGGEIAFVELFPASATVIVGATRAWQAYATDSAGVPVAATFAWQSLEPAIASVSAAGVVTGVSVGQARIVASAAGIADTAIATVETLPAGVDLVWQGGTAGAEDDWFTADNWSPARVPTATDVIWFGSSTHALRMDANAEVGGILGDSLSTYGFDLAPNVTLTSHGDVSTPYIYGDSTTRIVLAGSPSILWGWSLPPLVVRGDVSVLTQAYSYGDVVIEDGATLDVGLDGGVVIDGDLTVIGGGLVMSQDTTTEGYSYLSVYGDVVFDGGDATGNLTGGYMDVSGDFTVTAASCTAFQPTGLGVEMFSDTSTISIGCGGANGNRFWDLWIYAGSGTDHLFTIASDIYVANELYVAGDRGRLTGNGTTVSMGLGSIYMTTFDHVFVEVRGVSGGYLYADSLAFTGMAGETRSQIVANDAGDGCFSCYEWQRIVFDPTSSGPYIELNDLVADGDSVIYYITPDPGDGPQRVVTTGEASVIWAGTPTYVDVWSGYGQTGAALQPLPDSLVARVVDYGGEPVAGVTVTWNVTDSDGSVSPVTSVTDAAGLAATLYTMGSANYPVQEVVASTPGAASAYFYSNVSGTPAPPKSAAGPVTRPTARVAPAQREPRDIPAAPTRMLDNGERR